MTINFYMMDEDVQTNLLRYLRVSSSDHMTSNIKFMYEFSLQSSIAANAIFYLEKEYIYYGKFIFTN